MQPAQAIHTRCTSKPGNVLTKVGRIAYELPKPCAHNIGDESTSRAMYCSRRRAKKGPRHASQARLLGHYSQACCMVASCTTSESATPSTPQRSVPKGAISQCSNGWDSTRCGGQCCLRHDGPFHRTSDRFGRHGVDVEERLWMAIECSLPANGTASRSEWKDLGDVPAQGLAPLPTHRAQAWREPEHATTRLPCSCRRSGRAQLAVGILAQLSRRTSLRRLPVWRRLFGSTMAEEVPSSAGQSAVEPPTRLKSSHPSGTCAPLKEHEYLSSSPQAALRSELRERERSFERPGRI